MSETPEEVVDRALRLLTPAEPTLKRKHQTINVVVALRAAGMLPPRGTSEPSGNSGTLDEQVKRAAEALRQEEGFMETVDSALEITWSEYIARLVLTAAGVTSKPVVDEGRLAAVIENIRYIEPPTNTFGCHRVVHASSRAIARNLIEAVTTPEQDCQKPAENDKRSAHPEDMSAEDLAYHAGRREGLKTAWERVDQDKLADVLSEHTHIKNAWISDGCSCGIALVYKGGYDRPFLEHQARVILAWLKAGA